MNCISCKEDIPSKFTHALSINICPLCGKEIMPEELKNVLAKLKIVFDDAKNYMNEVEDWLAANFSFKRLKPNEIILDKNQYDNEMKQRYFSNTPSNRKDENSSPDDKANMFAKRAGVPDHKNTLDFIKGKGSFGAADPSEFVGVDDEYGEINSDNVEVDQNLTPLNKSEANQIGSIFADKNNTSSSALEIQKLKKLQSQSSFSNGGGKFRRG